MRDTRLQSFDIVHITSAHPVGDTRIFVKEAKSLARAGYRVAVLGPGDVAGQEIDESGVVQFTLPRPKSRAGRFTQFGHRLLGKALELKPRAVHLHDPDLLRLSADFQAAGVCVVYDMHEDFPKAVLSRRWLGPVVIRRIVSGLIERLETRALRGVDGVILADQQLEKRLPAAAPPNVAVRNLPDLSEWPDQLPTCPEQDQINCVYVGDITQARGALRMCDVVEAFLAKGGKVHLDLIGPCPSALKAQILARPAACSLTFHGRLDRTEVVKFLANSHVGFCLLEPTPAYKEALPVKLFEYLVSGLPVLTTDLPRICAETAIQDSLFPVSWCADADELAKALEGACQVPASARDAMRRHVRKNYDWSGESEVLLKFYNDLLGVQSG